MAEEQWYRRCLFVYQRFHSSGVSSLLILALLGLLLVNIVTTHSTGGGPHTDIAMSNFQNQMKQMMEDHRYQMVEEHRKNIDTAVMAATGSNPFRKRRGGGVNKVVPMSVILPCMSDDYHLIHTSLVSLANQTVYPHEVVLVLNVAKKHSNGSLLFNYNNIQTGDQVDYVLKTNKQGDPKKWEAKSLEAPLDDEFFDNVRPITKNEVDLSDFIEVDDAVRYVDSVLPSVREAFEMIPNIKIFIRSGVHYAGDNRVFGAGRVRNDTELISFFDCDDYMHPQRTEYLWQTFQAEPDLEAVVHRYYTIPITQWRRQSPIFLSQTEFPTNYTSSLRHPDDNFVYNYEELHEAIDTVELPEGTTEPNCGKGCKLWWFPRDLNLTRINRFSNAHNGWLTLKRNVLYEVPYPNTPTGQDSIYNWRLLKNRRNWNFLPLPLGAYIRQR